MKMKKFWLTAAVGIALGINLQQALAGNTASATITFTILPAVSSDDVANNPALKESSSTEDGKTVVTVLDAD